MTYALIAFVLALLGWGIWMWTRGREATKNEIELSKVKELGEELRESEIELDTETSRARKWFRDRRRERMRRG